MLYRLPPFSQEGGSYQRMGNGKRIDKTWCVYSKVDVTSVCREGPIEVDYSGIHIYTLYMDVRPNLIVICIDLKKKKNIQNFYFKIKKKSPAILLGNTQTHCVEEEEKENG